MLRGRLATLDAYVDALERSTTSSGDTGTHAQRPSPVALGVVFDELTFHNDFINRDLDLGSSEALA